MIMWHHFFMKWQLYFMQKTFRHHFLKMMDSYDTGNFWKVYYLYITVHIYYSVTVYVWLAALYENTTFDLYYESKQLPVSYEYILLTIMETRFYVEKTEAPFSEKKEKSYDSREFWKTYNQ